MRSLTGISVVSVVSAALIWLFVLPQLVGSGMIEPGPFIGVMVVIPTPVAWIAARTWVSGRRPR